MRRLSLLVLLVAHNPRQAAAGAIVVALGLPVYAIVERRRTRPEKAPAPGRPA